MGRGEFHRPLARVGQGGSGANPDGVLHALVAVEDLQVGLLLERLLEEKGFSTLRCSNGEQATSLLESRRFALIVADRDLPGTSGLGLVRRARTRNVKAPVLLLSPLPITFTAEQMGSLGVTRALLKPFDVSEFQALVREMLVSSGEPTSAPPVGNPRAAMPRQPKPGFGVGSRADQGEKGAEPSV